MRIIVSFRGIPQSPGWETGSSVIRALRSLGHEVYAWGHYYQQPRNKLPDHGMWGEYDLLIFLECNDADPQYTVLKNIPAKKKVAWLFDVAMAPAFYKSICDHMEFDHVFCGNPNTLDLFDQPTSFLPYAADLGLHYRHPVKAKKHVATLVGSDRQSRRDLIDFIKGEGIPAQLVTDVFRDEYIKTLSESMISICDVAGGGHGLMPMRFFEAPAAGSLLICQLDPADDRDQILREGEHYFGFHDLKDLPGLLSFLMDDVDEREKVWLNGHNEILRNHTYRERCLEILEV